MSFIRCANFTEAVHKLRTRSFVDRAAVVDTDSWDWDQRKVAVDLASVDILVVGVDSDVDSCSADKVDQAIEDKQECQGLNMEQAAEESFLELDPKLVADSLGLAGKLVVLACRKLEEAVGHMEMAPKLISAALELVGSETSLEIVDSTDCC